MAPLSHRRYRSLAWLALLAMLLAFVGPMISQTQRLMSPAHAMSEAPTAAHAAMAAHGEHAAMPMEDAPGVTHADMAACGYCDLFLHAPALLSAIPRAPPVQPPLPRPALESPAPIHRDGIYPRYASRAPPRFPS